MITSIVNQYVIHYYYYYNCFTALWILSGTTRVSRYQKGKTNLDFTEAGQMPFLLPNQQCQSTNM